MTLEGSKIKAGGDDVKEPKSLFKSEAFCLEIRNLKLFFRSDVMKLYIVEIILAVVLLAIAILAAALFGSR